MKSLLIANRGEIAIRIARTAAELGLTTVAIYAEDDAASLHVRKTDRAVALKGVGPAAYLDAGQIIAAAADAGCDAVHPGYGFLSENPAFAEACAQAGLTFVGPSPETLDLFGDKAKALALAESLDIPVLAGTRRATSLEEAASFLDDLGEGGVVMLKALAGGGGRGMRRVEDREELAQAFERCASEALAAFGAGDLYVEQFFPRARHVEVQIVGDGTGAVSHLWGRECSVQRLRQKLIEIAPAVGVPSDVRALLHAAAVRLGEQPPYKGLGTIEFLVNVDEDGQRFAFLEANPRLQVEHTVTEAVTGLDLVRVQLEIAAGRTLAELELTQDLAPAPRGVAIQARVNLETLAADGSVRPSGGVLSAYDPPSGPGVRVDGYGYAGYRTSARYDSLLAKQIVQAGDLPAAAGKAYRALCEFKVAGVSTNIPLLQAILQHPDFIAGHVHTRWVEEEIASLADQAATDHPRLHFEPAQALKRPGAKVDAVDPLAVLVHGKSGGAANMSEAAAAEPHPIDDIHGPEGTTPLRAPLQGTVVSLAAQPGDPVRAGQALVIMEAMKMEHVILAHASGIVREFTVAAGDTVFENHPLVFIQEADIGDAGVQAEEEVDLDYIRPDLAAVLERHRLTLDEARPGAVERRRKTGQRTARENVDDLLDPGSFVEYGPLVLAARRRRNTVEELIEQTPGDGMVMGLGTVNGAIFPDETARAAVVAYDYTVLAGTQGSHNHQKMDRLFEVAERARLPVAFFCEGGGGRPGDTESGGFIRGFEWWPQLSGLVPLIGITSGRCFAGNASVLGCCDVIIATKDSSIGMGGPAMIEGGGLGVFRPEEIGPVSVQEPNGVIDLVAEDEAAAVALAKRYLAYFQGPLPTWTCADQRLLRRAIPENRLRVYDIRKLIEVLADDGSVLEIRPKFGPTMIAALIRIEGRPMGLIANNPMYLGGAIDSDGADKAARFLQICEAFDLPVLSLQDTPGLMVGP
ncbi:MAG TPA: carboxyl transferase domain-containing protein, partial [Caulobacteraceae bacterium]|nr:carboxyl transferase domain-containing protein [Caulobacteraceae bacterium]